MEKLLPKSSLRLPKDAAAALAEEKAKEDSFVKAQRSFCEWTVPVEEQQGDPLNTVKEAQLSTAEEPRVPLPACRALGSSAAGERLFVFRDPPESSDRVDVPKRKRKSNFLNLKKASVAPAVLPSDL